MAPVSVDQYAVARRALVNDRAAAEAMMPRLGDPLVHSVFQYTATLTFTVAGQTIRTTIPIQSDAHFMCSTSQFDTTTQVIDPGLDNGGSLALITDGGTNRDLANAQVATNLIFGNAKDPYIWPMTHMFRANSYIGLTVTDTTGAAQVLRLVFSGIKVPLGSI